MQPETQDSILDFSVELDSLQLANDSNVAFVDSLASPVVKSIEVIPSYPNFFYTSYNADLVIEQSNIVFGTGQLLVILFLTLMLGLLNRIFAREALLILSSPFKRNGFRKLKEEESIILNRSFVFLTSIFIFVLSTFVFDIFSYLNVIFTIIPNTPFFFNVFILILGIVIFRMLIAKLFGHIFDLDEFSSDYNFRILIINCITGLIMLPFLIGLRLSPDYLIPIFAWSGVGVLIVFYTLGLATGADLGWHSERISKYHLFMYFCTLEIVPFIILFKALSSLN